MILRAASPRRRMTEGGIAVLLVIVTVATANAFVPPEKAIHVTLLGHDFLAFYTGGAFVREGRYQQLYDLSAVREFEQSVAREQGLELGDAFGPWWNPPFYAAIFAPLAALPYRTAWTIWLGINGASLLTAIVLLCRMLPDSNRFRWGRHSCLPRLDVLIEASRTPEYRHPRQTGMSAPPADWRSVALVPLLICTSMPCIMALGHAQNTCTSLLILCATVTFWRDRSALMTGLCAGLLCYKPQLAAILSVAIVAMLGWRAMIGLILSGGSLLVAGEWTMPGSLWNFVRQLPMNLRFMQVEHAYLWERHVTLKALWRLLVQGREAGKVQLAVTLLTAACAAAIVGGLVLAWFRRRRFVADLPWLDQTRAIRSDRFISAVILATPLLMPFYFDYDLLLLAVPAVLYAAERMRGGEVARADRWIFVSWCALFMWMFFNPGLAKATHVNGSALLLLIVAAQHLVRACEQATQLSAPTVGELRTPVVATSLPPAARRAA